MEKLNVQDYGVVANILELQTDKIQAVIDMCKEAGGEVCIPAGRYYIGSIRLYSDVTLHLLEGAELYGSRNYHDYQNFNVPTTLGYVTDPGFIKKWHLPSYYIYGMICAFEAENIAIIGEKNTRIDGQDCYDENGEEKFRGPMGIILCKCKNLTLSGYSFVNSANWSHQIDSCENVDISEVKVLAGHDGFNLHHCKNITVKDCHLETGDDCFAGYDISNLHVNNCYFNTACNSLRIGGNHIIFNNCNFVGPGKYPHRSENTYYTHRMFKYYSVKPDNIEKDADDIQFINCNFNNITMLLSYEFGNEELMHDSKPLRSMLFDNVTIEGITETSIFKGNGEKTKLIFKNTKIKSNKQFQDVPILEVDKDTILELENVASNHEVSIKVDKDTLINCEKCSNIKIL